MDIPHTQHLDNPIHLRVFGCEAYVHIPKTLRKKLDDKCRKCIFLGYGIDGQFGYRLWDPNTYCGQK